MAELINMKQPSTGIQKKGIYGFSWTTFFFGCFPALFRGDFITFIGFFVIALIVGLVTAGLGGIVMNIAWAFMYNGYYTKKLLEKGFVFDASEVEIATAKNALNLS